MFEKIIGNDLTKETLIKSVKLEKTSHSYLFVGIDGIGKKMIAKEFAKMLMCLDENKYCNKCKSCIEFDTNNNPDFFYIEPDGNSIKIEQIREVQRKVAEKPVISNKKIFIINDAEKMTVEAQNCLLKTLEEPPEYITIILITSNENNLLTTIKSRCTIQYFNKITDEELKKYLQAESIDLNILDMASGSIGKALKLKDKSENFEIINQLIKQIQNNKSILEITKSAEILYKSKEEIFDMLDYINVILLKTKSLKLINCINIVEDTKKRLKSNANYDMSIDNMLLNIWEEVNEKNSRS